MIITVKKPGYCPLRHQLTDGSYGCRTTGLPCDNDEVFPTYCSIRARTVIIQREQTETVPKHEEKPVAADLKSK